MPKSNVHSPMLHSIPASAVMIAQSKHFSGRHGYQFFGSSTAFSYHQLESAGWASTNAHQLYASGRLVRITLPPKEQLL